MLRSPWIRRPDFSKVRNLDYDAYWEERGWEIAASLKPREEIMLEMVPSGARVFDVGCGNSLLPVRLREKGAHVTVGDISSKVLDGYRKLGIEAIELDLEDVSMIRFDRRYDYIVLSEVLEHLRNPEEVMAMLAPHTERFLITVPNSAAYIFRYGLLVRGRFFTQWVYHPSEHLRYWSHTDMLDWLGAVGLDVEEVRVADGFTLGGLLLFLPRLWKNLFGYRMVYRCRV